MIIKKPYIPINKIFTVDIILQKVTETIIDEDYGTIETTLESYTVKGDVHFITTEDLRFLPSGALNIGELRVFFKDKYEYSGYTVIPNVKDRVVYQNTSYEIIDIVDHLQNGHTIYKEARCRKL